MATTPTVFFRGAATTTTSTVLSTVPASTTYIVTNIVVTNTSGSSGTFTLALDGVAIATTVAIAANATTFIDMKQVLATTKTITGGASATTVNFHITGVAVS
jgi:hypothetical protein